MASTTSDKLTYAAEASLRQLGENLRTARLRRNIPQAVLAKRSGVGLTTLKRLEKGDAGISLAVLANVLTALNLDDDLGKLADPGTDTVGQALAKQRGPRRARRPREVTLDTDF